MFNTTVAFGGETEPETADSPIIPLTDYAPPAPAANEGAESGGDLEVGEGANTTSATQPAAAAAGEEKPAESAPVDLLDTAVPSKEQSDMHDLV